MDTERSSHAAGGRFLPDDGGGKKRRGRTCRRWTALAGLILGDGLLIYMILGGLVDQGYGVVILAGISAYFGYRMH